MYSTTPMTHCQGPLCMYVWIVQHTIVLLVNYLVMAKVTFILYRVSYAKKARVMSCGASAPSYRVVLAE